MSYSEQPFCPGTTQTLSGATTTSRVNTGSTQGRVQVIFYNTGSVVVFIKAGTASVEATTSDYPLAPGKEVLTFRANTDGSPLYIAGITSSSTATVYLTPGDGV